MRTVFMDNVEVLMTIQAGGSLKDRTGAENKRITDDENRKKENGFKVLFDSELKSQR